MLHLEVQCQAVEAAFIESWHDTLNDYAQRRINSEKCLQASLYAGLRTRLKGDYRVFVEATVWPPEGSHQAIDLLICHNNYIVGAIELKYKPKVKIHRIGMYSDITKLLKLRNRRSTASKIKVEMRRYVGDTRKDKELFDFAPERRVIFGGYCQSEKGISSDFWKTHRAGFAEPLLSRRTPPAKLLICLARTDANLTVLSEIIGGKHIKATFESIRIDA